LLVNLGTPDAPTPAATRAFLKEFLSDPRVVEIPRVLWWPILHLFVLRTRPKASAARYERIWTRDGSPLRIHTERQAKLLRGYLGERKRAGVVVDYAMRYGSPSIGSKLPALTAQGCERVLLVPLYPQYSASTTATVFDAASRALARTGVEPEVRTVRHFHDDTGYIRALEQSVRDQWMRRGRPAVLLMSFHGIPRRAVDRGDPYERECRETARLLAEALGLAPEQYRVTFQSRFGRAEWLKPYTAEVLAELGRQRLETVDVICPGFVCDCLETLEEIAIEGKALFLAAGGGELRYIPCLNERHEWIAALADMVERNLDAWSLGAGPQTLERSRVPAVAASAHG
jgi:ferrochelatase